MSYHVTERLLNISGQPFHLLRNHLLHVEHLVASCGWQISFCRLERHLCLFLSLSLLNCLMDFFTLHQIASLVLSREHSSDTALLCTALHSSIHPSIYPSIHQSIHPSILTSIHSYVHTYMHTYIHTYIVCTYLACSQHLTAHHSVPVCPVAAGGCVAGHCISHASTAGVLQLQRVLGKNNFCCSKSLCGFVFCDHIMAVCVLGKLTGGIFRECFSIL